MAYQQKFQISITLSQCNAFIHIDSNKQPGSSQYKDFNLDTQLLYLNAEMYLGDSFVTIVCKTRI